ncbi:MAG TPA: hypothetical protein VGR25_07715 [bacterium]|jgi:hypothetical protein|nr:hypothetical protein [bacterium]
MDTVMPSLAELSDDDLLAKVTQLAAEERQVTALLIAHLAELDARRLYLGEGYSSLFTYCTQALHFSEHAAYGRIEAARASRKFPILLQLLSGGSLTLTTIALLAPHLTAENHKKLLDQARYRSKRAVEELIAQLYPRPAVPSLLRRLPTLHPVSASHHPIDQDSQPNLDTRGTAAGDRPTPTAPLPQQSATVTPLAPQRYKIQFTASAETYEKLLQVQNLLRRQIPNGDLDQVINRALTALLHELARKMLAVTERPRHGRPTRPGSRHIPAEVRRAVWLRDAGRCAFVGTKGRRCDEVGFLEFHHVEPARGGRTGHCGQHPAAVPGAQCIRS